MKQSILIQCSDSFDISTVRLSHEHYKFMLGLSIRGACITLIKKFSAACGRLNIVVIMLEKFVMLTLNFINE
jgi:hypothetical protein